MPENHYGGEDLAWSEACGYHFVGTKGGNISIGSGKNDEWREEGRAT